MSKQIILFTSQGCGPCKLIKERLPEFQNQYGVDTLVHNIDSRTEEGKRKTSDFKYSIGVSQGFAMFTPGVVIREIPSGRILASADGGKAKISWIISQLEANPDNFNFLQNDIPDTVSAPSMFSDMGMGTLLSDDVLNQLGLLSENAKGNLQDVFKGKRQISVWLQLITFSVFMIALYVGLNTFYFKKAT